MCAAVCGCMFLYCIFAGATLAGGLVRYSLSEVDLVGCLTCRIAVGAFVALWREKVVAGLVVWNGNFMVALCPASRLVGGSHRRLHTIVQVDTQCSGQLGKPKALRIGICRCCDHAGSDDYEHA